MSDFDSKLPLKYHYTTALSNEHQQPHSTQFDDVYFNSENGLDESKYVFIQGNDLLKRWSCQVNKTNFVIAETGFGTGLNFLATIHAWQHTTEKPQHLHFISVEKHPLCSEDLDAAHKAFPELALYSEKLIQHWKQFNNIFRHGFHQIKFSNDVTLTLGIGDATDMFEQLNAQVDAWFLDGFAPKKNPEMWNQSLFVAINRLSHEGTTVATFTAASQVKNQLLKNGFDVKKLPGFGKKREMICAAFSQRLATNIINKPWYPTPPTATNHKKVTILGAGIAGLSLAKHFKELGYHTTVIEKNAQPMKEASGNALAMVMPMLTAKNSPEMQFYIRAFETAKRFYTSDEFNATGVLQHLTNSNQQNWAHAINDLKLPGSLAASYNPKNLSLLYPSAGYVDTHKVTERLACSVDQWHHIDIEVFDQSDNGHWLLQHSDSNKYIETDLLVIANGIHAQKLFSNAGLNLTAKHGMTSIIQNDQMAMEHIQLADGYIIPDKSNNRLLCGATFDHLPQSDWYQPAQIHNEHWQRNKQLWQDHALMYQLETAKVMDAHAAIRATTPDHLPICGPLINQKQFKDDYQDLHHGRHWQQYPSAAIYENLYVLNGLGSRGFTSAPLLAQYLSAMISGEPLPLEIDLCKIIHPNRFLYRSCKKTPKTH